MLTNFYPNIWQEKVAFYLDGKRFQHKTNPKDQARAPRSREWRRKNEGPKKDCTAKNKNLGSGCKMAHFIVAIAYNNDVICEQYEKMNGKYFADFLRRNFVFMFSVCGKMIDKTLMQDEDTSQNSALAGREWGKCGATLLKIPPRSPEINPIENFFFNIITEDLRSHNS